VLVPCPFDFVSGSILWIYFTYVKKQPKKIKNMYSFLKHSSLDTGTCPVAVMEVVHPLVYRKLTIKLNLRGLPA
jgi:hypothetical protein